MQAALIRKVFPKQATTQMWNAHPTRMATAHLAVLLSLCAPLVHAAPLGRGSAAQPMQASAADPRSLEDVHHQAPVRIDYGAQFAGTPIVGTTVNFRWSEHVVAQLPRSACAPLYASIDRHTYWFKEAANSQQEMEKLFIANVSNFLCADPEQSDEAYTTILHSMLKQVRDAINTHTHSAFWVKSTCAALDDPCFDVTKLYKNFHGYFPSTPNETQCTEVHDVAGMDSCLGAVLTHEKHNLAEGFYFLNMSYYMLERGAEFCLDPNLKSILATMTVEMQTMIDYHSGNHAFDDLANSHADLLCTLVDEDEDTYLSAYDAMVDNIDRVTARAVEGSTTCEIGNQAFERMPWMKSNPPGVDDLITMIEGNTLIAIAAAAEAAEAVIGASRPGTQRACVDPATGIEDLTRTASLELKMDALGLPQDVYRAIDPNWANHSRQRVTSRTAFLAMPSVYHKLAPTCFAKSHPRLALIAGESIDDVNYTGVCVGAPRPTVEVHVTVHPRYTRGPAPQPQRTLIYLSRTRTRTVTLSPAGSAGSVYMDCTESSVHNSVPILDLATSTDIAKCNGTACKAAAKAIVAYQTMLGPLTPMRLDTLQIAQVPQSSDWLGLGIGMGRVTTPDSSGAAEERYIVHTATHLRRHSLASLIPPPSRPPSAPAPIRSHREPILSAYSPSPCSLVPNAARRLPPSYPSPPGPPGPPHACTPCPPACNVLGCLLVPWRRAWPPVAPFSIRRHGPSNGAVTRSRISSTALTMCSTPSPASLQG